MNNNDCSIEYGMSYDYLKGAIESGMILHDKILIEDGIDLNTNTNFCDGDGSKLLARVLAAINLLNVKYKNQNTFGFNNKFIATNKNTYDKFKSISNSFISDTDIYIVDDLKENYVCVGSKDNYNHSYTFKIG